MPKLGTTEAAHIPVCFAT